MARYSAFLGLQVEVQYRAGDILLPASGKFVGDTGRSIFLEQIFEQRGQRRQFRWEIPYQYVVRLAEKVEAAPVAKDSAAIETPTLSETVQDAEPIEESESTASGTVATAAAGFGSKISVIFPRPQ